MRILRYILWLEIVALFHASICSAQDARQVAKLVLPSVVVITTYDSGGRRIGLGSGFFVTDVSQRPRYYDSNYSTIVATNFHVVDGAAAADVKLVGSTETYKVTGVVAVNKQRDLVLLKVSNVRGTPLTLASAETEVGEEIYIVGNPEGLEGTISTGIVSSIGTRRMGGEDLMQITAAISHGSSGGPVVNKRGEVIGIAQASLSEGQSLNFAVPSEYLATLLANRTSPQPLSSVTNPRVSTGNQPTVTENEGDVCGDSPFSGYYDNAGDYISAGDALLGEKFDDQAKEAYKRAIRIEPKNSRAHYQLSIAYQRLRCYRQSLIEAQQASIIKPKEPLYRLGVSKALSQLGRHDEAIDVLKEGVKDKPKYADYHVNLGSQYVSLKRYAEAIEAFRTAVRFEPKNVDAHYFLGLLYLGVSKDKEGALQEYNILRKLDAERAEKLRETIQKTPPGHWRKERDELDELIESLPSVHPANRKP